MTILAGLAIRSAVLLATGLLTSACLANRSAALRHRVLASALLAAVLVTPVSVALPEWRVTVPAPVLSTAPAVLLPVAMTSENADPPPSTPAALSPIVAVWLAGVVVAQGFLLAGLLRVGAIAGRASPVEDAAWLELLDTVAGRHGLTRRIRLSRTDSPDLLATWGFLRPEVLLPCHAEDWTADRAHVVLCHELAHVRRHDWAVQMGAETVRALLWFNPLAWLVCARLRRESEGACDDEVLRLGVGGRDYAGHLLALARQCRRAPPAWASDVSMAQPSTLERRIAAMLNPQLDRRAPSRGAMAALGVVLMLVTVSVGAVRARQAGPAPLSGTIYDVTGGVLPGVEVELVDADAIRSVAVTDATGRFEFPPVNPGTYVLEAALVGFRPLRQEIALEDARDWHRAITLQVGEVRETIVVRESRVTAGRPAPGRAGPGPVRVGGNIRPPLKEVHVRPVYPAAMREAGLGGVVPIEAIIGRDGSVSSVRVLSAQVHPDLAVAAVDAVRQWRFTPTLLNGAAVEVVMTVSVRFDLEE